MGIESFSSEQVELIALLVLALTISLFSFRKARLKMRIRVRRRTRNAILITAGVAFALVFLLFELAPNVDGYLAPVTAGSRHR